MANKLNHIGTRHVTRGVGADKINKAMSLSLEHHRFKRHFMFPCRSNKQMI